MAQIDASTAFAVVGGGKMGEAITGGLIASDAAIAAPLGAGNFTVANPGQARREYLTEAYHVACVKDASQIPAADIVLLAVKPQKTAEVLEAMANDCGYLENALVISVVAGWTCERLESFLPATARVVRVLPNTPLLVGQGASVVCGGTHATGQDVQTVCDLFACLGKAWIVPEDMIDVEAAIASSGVAYQAAFIEALTHAAVTHGFTAEQGEAFALQMVAGTAALMQERGQGAEKTRIDVCSPGGMTLAGLEAMAAAGFEASIHAGVDAAIERSKELGKL